MAIFTFKWQYTGEAQSLVNCAYALKQRCKNLKKLACTGLVQSYTLPNVDTFTFQNLDTFIIAFLISDLCIQF